MGDVTEIIQTVILFLCVRFFFAGKEPELNEILSPKLRSDFARQIKLAKEALLSGKDSVSDSLRSCSTILNGLKVDKFKKLYEKSKLNFTKLESFLDVEIHPTTDVNVISHNDIIIETTKKELNKFKEYFFRLKSFIISLFYRERWEGPIDIIKWIAISIIIGIIIYQFAVVKGVSSPNLVQWILLAFIMIWVVRIIMYALFHLFDKYIDVSQMFWRQYLYEHVILFCFEMYLFHKLNNFGDSLKKSNESTTKKSKLSFREAKVQIKKSFWTIIPLILLICIGIFLIFDLTILELSPHFLSFALGISGSYLIIEDSTTRENLIDSMKVLTCSFAISLWILHHIVKIRPDIANLAVIILFIFSCVFVQGI